MNCLGSSQWGVAIRRCRCCILPTVVVLILFTSISAGPSPSNVRVACSLDSRYPAYHDRNQKNDFAHSSPLHVENRSLYETEPITGSSDPVAENSLSGLAVEDDEELAVVVTFEDILRLTVFIAVAWLMSNACVGIGLPGLVGEIACGFLLGPPLANFCPFPAAMVLIGNFGLLGLMLESGIHLDISQLRETGTRAVLMAVSGTLLALVTGLGFGFIPTNDGGTDFSTAMAIGASFAPSSLGVAAAVLSTGEVLNTPIGQLIVASSVVDDVLGLILLAILNVFVMEDPTTFHFVQPFLASFGFLIVLGYSGITWIPQVIQNQILPRIPEQHQEKATFAIMFMLMIVYLPLLNYSGASYLTGAFLAGLSVSKLPSIHTTYARNGRELMVWLMRVFFAATIGFQVPILRYNDIDVLKWAAKFIVPVIAKLPLGLLVPTFRKEVPNDFPFNPYWRDAIITSLSVVCRGEFNFVVASFGLSSGLLDANSYSSIVLAVLLSSVLGPLLLSKTIAYYNKLSQEYLSTPHPVNRFNSKSTDGYRPLFIAIQIRTPTSWGLHEKFQHSLQDLGLLILDHRTWHTNEIDAVAMSEIFVQDTIQNVTVKNCFADDDAQMAGDVEAASTNDSTNGSSFVESLTLPAAAFTTSDPMQTMAVFGIAAGDPVTTTDEAINSSTPVAASGRSSTRDAVESTGPLVVLRQDGKSGSIGTCTQGAINLRLEQVRLALIACLGDMDPSSYAVQATQWEAFTTESGTGHNRQRTYTFQDIADVTDNLSVDLSILDSSQSAAGPVNPTEEDLEEDGAQSQAPPSRPLSSALKQASSIYDEERPPHTPTHVTFNQDVEEPESTDPTIPQPSPLGRPHPRGKSHGSVVPHHRRSHSLNSHLNFDLWETDERAHECFRPGHCVFFQPTVAGHCPDNTEERWLALAQHHDDELVDDAHNNENSQSNASQANQEHSRHRRRRSRHFSEEWRMDEETAAIQHCLHGYIRR